MRVLPALLLFSAGAQAQFRSTVPLVVAPITVTDAKGRYIDGLTENDLLLSDNNVPQRILIKISSDSRRKNVEGMERIGPPRN